METFGGAEIWNLRASFMLVGTDARADIPLPDTVRRYFFPGVTHGGGRGGFSSAETAANGCELPANPAPSAPMRSALTKAFVAWVTTGAAMPPSRYPTIADGTLVPDTGAALRFPVIPGGPAPVMRPLLDYDLGPEFNYQDASGVLKAAVKVKRSLPQLVVKVDADGNEVAGIKSPLLAAPLGTYTGWNVTAAGPLKGQSCGLSGGFIPFAKTKAERLAKGDPRPSLEERYRSHDEYVQIVSAAAGQTGAGTVSDAAGRRRDDHAGRGERRPSLRFRRRGFPPVLGWNATGRSNRSSCLSDLVAINRRMEPPRPS